MRKIYAAIISILFTAASFNASARQPHNIDKGWLFYRDNSADSTVVSLPHTWGGDYRGTGNYKRYLDLSPQWRGKRIFVRFHGSSGITELIVNGRYAGSHKGGNNAFQFEITDLVDFSSRNFMWVKVSNAERTDILPTAGTEVIYGGIFRDVELIVADRSLIGMDEYGSNGVEVQVQRLNESIAECRIKVRVNSSAATSGEITAVIIDAEGKEVAVNSAKSQFKKGISEINIPVKVENPHLWNGTEDPYLYRFSVRLTDENGGKDLVEFKSGFRQTAITDKGFTLNGKPYRLKGVILHRDRAMYGPVALAWQTAADLDAIQEMGANAVRVANGTHSQHFYDECDRRGIIVVNDSPFVGSRTLDAKGYYNTDAFRENARLQLSELIRQNVNHPCIAAWNIFVEPELMGDDPIPFIRELNALSKLLDPSRATSGCSSRDGVLNTVTDAIIWNQILGWVDGFPRDIAIWRELLFGSAEWKRLKSAVSYRCGGSVLHQEESPAHVTESDTRHPESYQAMFHEIYMREVASDDRFWGVFVGDMFDFASQQAGVPGINRNISECGLITFDRAVRKDAFYLYKANWNDSEHFVHITGRRAVSRPLGIGELKVYSNCGEVELILNGVSLGTKQSSGNGIFTWNDIELSEGRNEIEAVAGESRDGYAVIGLPVSSTHP